MFYWAQQYFHAQFSPNYETYLEHIVHGNIVGGKTISKNVYQVPAANFLKFYDNKLKLNEFWKLQKLRSNISLQKKLQKFDKIFKSYNGLGSKRTRNFNIAKWRSRPFITF